MRRSWSALAAALDLCLFFDADFGFAVGDQLICKAQAGSDVGKRPRIRPAAAFCLSIWRRLRLALAFASARGIHAPPPFFAPACSVLMRS